MAERFVKSLTATPSERISTRQVLRSGSSPWRRGDTAPAVDTTVGATCGECYATYIATADGRSAEDNLGRHVVRGHPVQRREVEESAVQAAAVVIMAKIERLQLKPGAQVTQTMVMEWCAVSKRQAAQVVSGLVARGTLARRSGRMIVAEA